jgi:hypothetical protein
MQEQNYVLITAPGKSPVIKRPMAATADAVIRLLDDCLARETAPEEIRTVCIVDEWGEFDVWGEKPFRVMFDTNN